MGGESVMGFDPISLEESMRYTDKTTKVQVSNAITNGNFVNSEGWSTAAGSLDVINNTAISTGNGTGAQPNINQVTNLPIIAGQKVYVRARIRVTNPDCNFIQIRFTGSDSGTALNVASIEPLTDKWYDLSVILQVTNQVGALRLYFRHVYNDAESADQKSMEVQEVIAVNMGTRDAPNEFTDMTHAEMDDIFTDWFNNKNLNEELYLKRVKRAKKEIARPFRSHDYTYNPDYNSIITSLSETGCDIENLGVGADNETNLYGISYGDLEGKPVFFAVSNQHGSEWMTVPSCIEFMTRIANEDYYDDDVIAQLRNKLSFYLIVSANPWGYINNSFENFNGVNLNRNWDNNWSQGDVTGVAPFSEPETVIVRDKFLSLAPHFAVDVHTSSQPGIDIGGNNYTLYGAELSRVFDDVNLSFDDASFKTRTWNIGAGQNFTGWARNQMSKSGYPTISTLLEGTTSYDGDYILTMLFAMAKMAANKVTQ